MFLFDQLLVWLCYLCTHRQISGYATVVEQKSVKSGSPPSHSISDARPHITRAVVICTVRTNARHRNKPHWLRRADAVPEASNESYPLKHCRTPLRDALQVSYCVWRFCKLIFRLHSHGLPSRIMGLFMLIGLVLVRFSLIFVARCYV